MSRAPEAVYKDCNIFTIAIPAHHGKWTATAEIQKADAFGLDTFQGATDPVLADTEEDARTAARVAAMRRIDEIMADPE